MWTQWYLSLQVLKNGTGATSAESHFHNQWLRAQDTQYTRCPENKVTSPVNFSGNRWITDDDDDDTYERGVLKINNNGNKMACAS